MCLLSTTLGLHWGLGVFVLHGVSVNFHSSVPFDGGNRETRSDYQAYFRLAVILSVYVYQPCVELRQSWLRRRSAADHLAKLQPAVYSYANAERGDHNNDRCSICFETLPCFGVGCLKMAVTTPCQHVFHRLCLKAWFRLRDNCPTCRRSLE
jgi:hypothetical protein